MYLILWYPIPSLILFSIAPIIAGWRCYDIAGEDQDKFGQIMKGVGIGLLIDLPFLCFVLWGFSAM